MLEPLQRKINKNKNCFLVNYDDCHLELLELDDSFTPTRKSRCGHEYVEHVKQPAKYFCQDPGVKETDTCSFAFGPKQYGYHTMLHSIFP